MSLMVSKSLSSGFLRGGVQAARHWVTQIRQKTIQMRSFKGFISACIKQTSKPTLQCCSALCHCIFFSTAAFASHINLPTNVYCESFTLHLLRTTLNNLSVQAFTCVGVASPMSSESLLPALWLGLICSRWTISATVAETQTCFIELKQNSVKTMNAISTVKGFSNSVPLIFYVLYHWGKQYWCYTEYFSGNTSKTHPVKWTMKDSFIKAWKQVQTWHNTVQMVVI